MNTRAFDALVVREPTISSTGKQQKEESQQTQMCLPMPYDLESGFSVNEYHLVFRQHDLNLTCRSAMVMLSPTKYLDGLFSSSLNDSRLSHVVSFPAAISSRLCLCKDITSGRLW